MDISSESSEKATRDAGLMPQPGNRPPEKCPGDHRGMSACPWCHFDPIYPDRPVRSVRVHFTLGRDRNLAYCGVRGEQTTMTGTISCSDCDERLDAESASWS